MDKKLKRTIIMIAIGIAFVGAGFAKRTITPSVCIGGCLIALGVRLYERSKRKEAEAEAAAIKKAKKEERLRKKQYEEDCVKFYKAVKKMRVAVNDDETTLHDLAIIAKNSDCSFEKEQNLVEAYKFGKNVDAEIKAQKKEQKRLEAEEKERQRIEKLQIEAKEIDDEQKCRAKEEGKNKYTSLMREKIAEEIKREEGIKKARETAAMVGAFLSASTSYTPPKQENWGLKAGIAAGIAGPAAGIAVASEIMANNAQREAEARINSEKSEIWVKQYKEECLRPILSAQYKGDYKTMQKKVDKFNEKLVDDMNVEDKAKDIQIDVADYEITAEGNLNVTINVNVLAEEWSVIGREAVLDGNFELKVIKDNDVVGCGIFSGGGYGIMDLKYAGFMTGRYEVRCYCSNLLEVDDKVSIEVKPMSLWYIEK